MTTNNVSYTINSMLKHNYLKSCRSSGDSLFHSLFHQTLNNFVQGQPRLFHLWSEFLLQSSLQGPNKGTSDGLNLRCIILQRANGLENSRQNVLKSPHECGGRHPKRSARPSALERRGRSSSTHQGTSLRCRNGLSFLHDHPSAPHQRRGTNSADQVTPQTICGELD